MNASDTYNALTRLDALHSLSSDTRIAQLIEATDALAASLQTLRTHPTPEGAERMATQLCGMYRQAVSTINSLIRERAA